MTDPVILMGAGVRTDDAAAVVADADSLVRVHLADRGGFASIDLPPYAARHFAERLLLKAAEVESMMAAGPAESPSARTA